ncbi:NAD+ synthase [Chitinivorax sp. B]|uniref:NAD+ synthase n=1 Tax=Chitinivorax sp. B TaxID=2502235 RepID=UPI0010F68469|nr:NAD+ synthase [Chitinivorax sp. B]
MKNQSLSIACAQLNPRVGDILGNSRHIQSAWLEAQQLSANLLIMPEMALSGYPAEDLVLKPEFMDCIEREVSQLQQLSEASTCALLLTTPWRIHGVLANAALLIDQGEIKQVLSKQLLPNYGVFDELRIFSPGRDNTPIELAGIKLGVLLCEDGWQSNVAQQLQQQGAQALLALNASPYSRQKRAARLAAAGARVQETGLPLLYVNLLGGQDELVFDGAGFALNAQGQLAATFPAWQPSLDVVTLVANEDARWQWVDGPHHNQPADIGDAYAGMVLGLRDYVIKNGFPGVVLGLSGGIDSALVAVAAADALGPDQVLAVMMPSRYTSQDSLDDAKAIADALGIRLHHIAIEPAHTALEGMLNGVLGEQLGDLTGQNLQARTRGVTLMALSNQLNYMLLTTGNKSEMAVGYATLYGDMCGGFNPLKDVYKTDVYVAAQWRNQHTLADGLAPAGQMIPDRVLTKAPTAELKPGQKDQDNLPAYDELDAILHGLVELEQTVADLVSQGFARDTVLRVWTLLERAEYKRRQAPPGVKLSEKALSRERRYPMTNGFVPHLQAALLVD